MSETVRYGLIGKQDIKRGFSTFQVVLADGQVVTLDEVDIAYLTADAYTEANLPTTGTGRLARVTDGAKGLWMLGANNTWYALNGECVNVNDFATLAAAITDISTTTRTLIISDTVTVSANLTIPANVTCLFTNQGQISVNAATTLTFSGLIRAPRRQIFAGSGTVNFADGSTGTVYPEWFGAVVDGSDDTSKVQTTVDACSTSFGGVVEISPRTIWTPGSVTIPSGVLVMDYSDPDAPVWRTSASTRTMMENLDGMGLILNARLSVTMTSNTCVVALKTNAGNDPSASDPVKIAFRSATAASGLYVTRSVTSATSITVPDTATLGTSNSVAHRIYIGALDNAGTVELYLINTVSGTALYLPPENELITTTAIGTGADSAIVYSTSARTNVAHRVLGYFESTQTTAGTWAAAASKIQLMGPGVRRTGDIVQRKLTVDSAVATGTTVLPVDNSIPQNTEGDQYLSQAITPSSAINFLRITSHVHVAHSADGNLAQALFQDSTAGALKASSLTAPATNNCVEGTMSHTMAAGTTSATTFKIRAGSNGAGTTTFNGASGARLFGGVIDSSILVEEIMA